MYDSHRYAYDTNHYKFTGKERDAETGLDYFGARHYSNGLGRFITPDWAATPEPVPYGDLADPQSLNQYTYVRNLPTSRTDLNGHDGVGTTLDLVSDEEVSSLITSVGRGIAWGAAATTAAVTTVVVTTGVVVYHSVEATKAELAANQADRDLAKAQDRLNQLLVNKKKQQQQQQQTPDPQMATHKKDARESTRQTHEEGDARRKRDRGGEKGDARRRPPRKRPPGWKGPWPPKPPEKPPERPPEQPQPKEKEKT